ncbi:MAG TPA: ABC transporter ATP-binding protein/permease [Candidatus Borkfalkia excrementigallinarum]|uniref:ABC transporter ATP-binding protein/permease n=1 Tax=Candidatus Borkfalkia excrementigallinarum TaxID=2838506 RepID=A0A9D1ZXN3_9FIRM|nr:ABC transporter ATP-binding protein/permease [Candidatus Borkfalkia excrementigallinarum]
MAESQKYFNEQAFKKRNKKSTVLRLLKSMGKQKLRLAVVLLAVILYTAFNVIAPLYSATVVDLIYNRAKEAIAAGTVFTITWQEGGLQILILAALYAGAWLFFTLQSWLMASFAETLNLQLRSEIAQKLNKMPLAFFDRNQAGAIMSRATNDLDKMSEALQTGLLKLFTAIGTIVGSLVLMFSFDVWLTLLFLAFMAVSLLFTKLISGKTLKSATERQKCVGDMNAIIEESYSGRNIIKAFNHEEQSKRDVHLASERLADAACKADFITNAVNPAVRLINRIGQVVITILAGAMLLDGRLSPGQFQAYFQYISQASEPITEMSYMINTLQSALASAGRVYELLDEEELPREFIYDTIHDAKGEVEFSHVRFGYSPDKILMQDISFIAKPGQKIAIVGSTGAGKTTMINLLMRFYEVNGGKIFLDGIDTQELTRANLRQNFGMVLQDTWLFEGTIAENIAYGKPDATREEIVAAAKAARADFFIRTMPEGYDTVLTNDAENISVGQRQLLTIARVMLCNPPILILDEATSSVDTRTEMEIGKAMNALMRNRTSFVIAHRLSTIVDADLILVMANGNIIEQGNHRQLLAAGGAYAELYNSQFA